VGILLFACTAAGVMIPMFAHTILLRLRLATAFGLPGETLNPAKQRL